MLFLPSMSPSLSADALRKFYENVGTEASMCAESPADAEVLRSYYRSAGLIGGTLRREFFMRHFAYNLAVSVRAVFADGQRPRVLDIGCGMGTQSILFALLGASVVGVDMDREAVDIARRRAAFYGRSVGHTLEIEWIVGNALTIDYATLGGFDVLYSLFAFNMIQPTRELLRRIRPALNPGARFVVQDGNRRMWFNRWFRRRPVLDARELQRELEELGFQKYALRGGYALPPIAWALPSIAAPVDHWLRRYELFAGSWLHIATLGR